MNKEIILKALRGQIKFNEKFISEVQVKAAKLEAENIEIKKEIDILYNEK